MYDPVTGSFIQPDSLVPGALNPAAWNRYSYVFGNPANYVDPSGHFPLVPLAP
jgi:RHS repeat-associated protein